MLNKIIAFLFFTVLFALGILIVIVITLSHFAPESSFMVQDTLPEPDIIVMVGGEKCFIYEGNRHGATLYAMLCEGQPIRFTSDWTFIPTTIEETLDVQ